jgi:hypothetical protein
MADIEKIKLGDTTYDLKDTAAARLTDAIVDTTEGSTTTRAVGGISVGTDLNGQSAAAILKTILFADVPFTFTGITTSAAAGAYEYGDNVIISTVTPTFTKGSKNINSISIGTFEGVSDLYYSTSVTSDVAINFDEAETYSGTDTGTIYCTLRDEAGFTDTKSAEISRAYYTYYAVTDSAEKTPPTTWIPVGSTTVEDISITANAGKYIWIAVSGENEDYTAVWERNDLSGKYESSLPTEKLKEQTLLNKNGYICNNKYTFYLVTIPRKGSGTTTFKLK